MGRENSRLLTATPCSQALQAAPDFLTTTFLARAARNLGGCANARGNFQFFGKHVRNVRASAIDWVTGNGINIASFHRSVKHAQH